MAWTTPRTWVVNELVTDALLNTHVRDNLDILKNPPSAHYEANESADYTNNVTASWSDVDATSGKFNLSITTGGGDVLVGFAGAFAGSASLRTLLNIQYDGTTRVAADDGIVAFHVDSAGSAGIRAVSLVYLIPGLSAGPHSFKLQWKVTTGTVTLYAGAGTASADLHPQFWVREVS